MKKVQLKHIVEKYGENEQWSFFNSIINLWRDFWSRIKIGIWFQNFKSEYKKDRWHLENLEKGSVNCSYWFVLYCEHDLSGKNVFFEKNIGVFPCIKLDTFLHSKKNWHSSAKLNFFLGYKRQKLFWHFHKVYICRKV